MSNIDQLLGKCRTTGDLTRAEIIELLSLQDEADIDRLIATASAVRQELCGDDVHVRGLIEFSNVCRKSCNYCGLRAPNSKVTRYRMSPDEIVETALNLAKKDIHTVVLQSGEDPHYSGEMIADIVRRIKAGADMAITLCVGERPYEDYKLWKEAGADRYLLRHETASRELFKKLHPDTDFDARMQCLRWLRELGYQTGAGCMVGMPGQTIENMADDIEFFRDFQPDMAGIGPFIPHPETPYAECPTGTVQMTLKMVALARIVTRDALLPATTAIGSIEELGREMALEAGADVVMPNYTPLKYRENYEIYPNKRCISEDPELCHGCMRMRIESIGRVVSTTAGHSRKRKPAKV